MKSSTFSVWPLLAGTAARVLVLCLSCFPSPLRAFVPQQSTPCQIHSNLHSHYHQDRRRLQKSPSFFALQNSYLEALGQPGSSTSTSTTSPTTAATTAFRYAPVLSLDQANVIAQHVMQCCRRATFSALAVTYGFRGSPHIDKQNTGPFYGLALGNFSDTQGGICVEVNAFTVAHVQTKNCLAKVDE